MALIRCPECGAQISDMATSCPHCGYPLQPFYAEPIDLTPKKEAAPVHTPETPTGYTMFDDSIGKPIDGRKRKKTGVILSIVLICIVAFGAWAVKLSKDNPDSDKGTNEKASQKAYEPTTEKAEENQSNSTHTRDQVYDLAKLSMQMAYGDQLYDCETEKTESNYIYTFSVCIPNTALTYYLVKESGVSEQDVRSVEDGLCELSQSLQEMFLQEGYTDSVAIKLINDINTESTVFICMNGKPLYSAMDQ